MTSFPYAIGTGAVGIPFKPPTPEATATVTVRTERDYAGGYRTDETHTYRWAGYTAKDAMNHRIERLKECHRDYDRNGMEIITAIDKGEWLETITYRYEDGAA